MSTVSIQFATEKDLPRLVELLSELFSLEADFSPDADKQMRGLRQIIASPAAKIFVAKDGDWVVGMCSVQLVISTAAGKEVGWVEDVIVDKAYRGQHVGTRLLEALEAWAAERGLARLQLQADRENTPALAFYAKRNWRTTRLIGLWKV